MQVITLNVFNFTALWQCLLTIIDICADVAIAIDPQGVIATNSDVSIKVNIFLPSSAINAIDCTGNLGNGAPVAVDTNTTFREKYYAANSYTIEIHCYSQPPSHVMTWPRTLVVEDLFTNDNLDLHCIICNGRYSQTNDFQTAFRHNKAKPIRYQLSVGGLSGFKSTLTTHDLLTQVDFYLTTTDQKKLSAGVHDFILVAFNYISTFVLEQQLYISLYLKNLSIECDLYIGMKPNSFIVEVSLGAGAPANVTIWLKRSDYTLATAGKFCKQEHDCKQFSVAIKNPGSIGSYYLEALAENTLNNVIADPITVHCLPQIYDLYVFASTSRATADTELSILVRGDNGIFNMTVQADNQLMTRQLTIDQTKKRNLIARLPFDGSDYEVEEFVVTLSIPGFHDVNITITNEKQFFNYTHSFPIGRRFSCVKKIQMRGAAVSSAYNPIKSSGKIVLSTDVIVDCVENSLLTFAWTIYKTSLLYDVPKPKDKIYLSNTDLTQPEIVINENQLEPGRYVAFVEVRANINSATPSVVEKQFAFFEIAAESLVVRIEGGNRREIGEK